MLLSASAVSAQDYTWTLSDFYFDRYGPLSDDPASYTLRDYGTSASGTLVLARNGMAYDLVSYNFTTTTGDIFNGGSGLGAVYDSNAFENSSSDGFSTHILMEDVLEETFFRLSWSPGALFAEMDMEGQGNEVDGGTSREYQIGGDRRMSGTGAEVCPPGQQPGAVDCFDHTPGILTLTSITNIPEPPMVNTPEPGTMAILGAGLLGLFAARRRRAA